MKELMLIQSELKAPKSQRNSFGNYNYRSCEDILEAVKPLLLKHECCLTINDEISCNGIVETEYVVINKNPTAIQTQRVYIKATATITNKEDKSISVSGFARESANKTGMDSSQLTGATSSYARKYALNGLFCIDDTKDADSTNTHGKEEAKAPVKAPVKKPEVVNDKEKKMRIFVVEKLKEQIGIDLNVKLKDLTDIEKEAFKEAVVDATGHADIMTIKGDVLENTYKAFGGK